MQTPGATMVRVLHHLCKQELTDSVQWRWFDRSLINTARYIPALAKERQGSGYRTYDGYRPRMPHKSMDWQCT